MRNKSEFSVENESNSVSSNLKEAGKLFSLALPLMGTQVAQMSMGLLDTIMAGRYSSTDLAGVALGGSILIVCLFLYLWIIRQPFTQYHLNNVTSTNLSPTSKKHAEAQKS